jgi:signal transduction histidine kinase
MGKPLRLLLIEDQEDHALLLVRELGKGGFDVSFRRAETAREQEEALDEGCWDAVIADFNLPGFNGLDALRMMQARGLDLPFILVSGVIGEETAVEAMKAGAHDFILKGKYARLVPALERELREAEIRRERRQAEAELEKYREHLEELVAERTHELERELTERKRVEEEIITLNDRLKHLIGAVKELSSAHTLDRVQRIVTVSARKLTGADGATMVLREGDYCYYADEDAIEPLWKGKKFQLTSCISGWVMLNRVPAVIDDIYADERIPVEAYKPTFVKSLAMIPVRTNEPIAAIGNYWKDRHSPSEMEIQLLQTLADAAARAVENVRLLNELEERVQERTVQLEAVNKELEAFSYSVSHDLKAPLRGIDGYSRLLEEDYHHKLDAEGRRFLLNIRQGAAQMHQLIEDLLDYSRFERRTRKSVTLDLSALVQAVAAERLPEAEQSGVLVRLEVPVCTVLVDREGLIIVLRNLLENALKFSRKAQPPTIEIGARREGDKAILWVRDNGIGFDMKFHDRIFDMFQRLQRAEDYPGTGIGLALVRKAMQRMGGRVWAESAPGAGATFFLELPR